MSEVTQQQIPAPEWGVPDSHPVQVLKTPDQTAHLQVDLSQLAELSFSAA